MSEKQSDIFDDQFKKAAEQYEPEFSEAAWLKMLAKLTEQKRRRFAGWWWFADALMIGLMVFMATTLDTGKITPIEKKTSPEKDALTIKEKRPSAVATKQIKTSKSGAATTDKVPSTNVDIQPFASIKKGATVSGAVTESTTATGSKVLNNKLKKNDLSEKDYNSSSRKNASNTTRDSEQTAASKHWNSGLAGIIESPAAEPVTNNNSLADNANPLKPATPDPKEKVEKAFPAELNAQAAKALNSTGKEIAQAAIAKEIEEITGNPDIKPTPKATSKPAMNRKGFFLYAGFGPERSGVKGNDAGRFTLNYGAGIGYNLSGRIGVQLGIFSSQKDYRAGPADYKPKPGSYFYSRLIYHVNAECSITEIPLSVNYTAIRRKRQNIVFTLGFSSMIMKKEWYNYHFKRSNGAYGQTDYIYKTNKVHLFAATTISGSYQFEINKYFKLTASPFIKMPLAGVGEGSVKIQSAGLMLGAVYQLPHAKK